MAYTGDLKSSAERHKGSSPFAPTNMNAINILQAINQHGLYCQFCRHKATTLIIIRYNGNRSVKQCCDTCYESRKEMTWLDVERNPIGTLRGNV